MLAVDVPARVVGRTVRVRRTSIASPDGNILSLAEVQVFAAPPTTDQRGFSRPFGLGRDIGSFESGRPACSDGDASGDQRIDRAGTRPLAPPTCHGAIGSTTSPVRITRSRVRAQVRSRRQMMIVRTGRNRKPHFKGGRSIARDKSAAVKSTRSFRKLRFMEPLVLLVQSFPTLPRASAEHSPASTSQG